MLTPSGTVRRSPSSKLVDVDEPMLVDVVALPWLVEVADPLLVEVVAPALVDVVALPWLVDVVSSTVVGVDEVGDVTLVGVEALVEDVASRDVPVASDEAKASDVLVDSVGVVIEVNVPSSPLAQATPTTASAATTDVRIPRTFLTICYLLGEPWGPLCVSPRQEVFRSCSRSSQGAS